MFQFPEGQGKPSRQSILYASGDQCTASPRRHLHRRQGYLSCQPSFCRGFCHEPCNSLMGSTAYRLDWVIPSSNRKGGIPRRARSSNATVNTVCQWWSTPRELSQMSAQKMRAGALLVVLLSRTVQSVYGLSGMPTRKCDTIPQSWGVVFRGARINPCVISGLVSNGIFSFNSPKGKVKLVQEATYGHMNSFQFP